MRERCRYWSVPFVDYIANQPSKAVDHFHGIREAIPDFRGVALIDRVNVGPRDGRDLEFLTWRRREIENYLCSRATLEAYAREPAEAAALGPIFVSGEVESRLKALGESIREIEKAMETLGEDSPWSHDT